MSVKTRITALADARPDLLGSRGKLTYMLCSVIPENYDVSDMSVLDIMDILPEQHLEYIYSTIQEGI